MRNLEFRTFCAVALLVLSAIACGANAREGSGCRIDRYYLPDAPIHVSARVYGLASRQEVRRRTAVAKAVSGATISPDYKNLPRIFAGYVWRGLPSNTIAAIVDGNIPQVGDIVELEMRHRDPRSPCRFIPVTVVPRTPAF
jgi:hypothetical protein